MIIDGIDTSDIPETDFSDGFPNPFAKKIKENGYSITIHYRPEDTAELLKLDPDEQKAMEEYHANK